MEPSQPHYQRNSRMNSGLSTIPSLSISTSTSCASSVLSASPTTISDSPYYYYTSPVSSSSSSSSPTTSAANPHASSFRQSHRSLEKRSHSASVRLRRRTSIPVLPPQRSASAGSTLIKESSVLYQQQHHPQRLPYVSSSSSENNFSDDYAKTVRYNIIDDHGDQNQVSSKAFEPPAQQQRWDDSQLAMELADDLPSSPTLSTRENIKIKVRQWITPNTKQQRRPIHKWFSDRMA